MRRRATRGVFTTRVAMAVGLSIAALAGCDHAPAARRAPLALEPLPQQTVTLRAEQWYRPHEGAWQYEILAGDNAGETITAARRKTDRFDATWKDVTGEGRAEYWRVDDEGRVVLTAVLDPAEDSLSRFEPPLVIAYREMRPGEHRTEKSTVAVLSARAPEEEKDRGPATRTLTFLGVKRLSIDGDEVEVLHVRSEFKAELRFAAAERTTDHFIALDGPGWPLAYEHDEHIRAFGLFGSRTRQTLLRRDEADGQK